MRPYPIFLKFTLHIKEVETNTGVHLVLLYDSLTLYDLNSDSDLRSGARLDPLKCSAVFVSTFLMYVVYFSKIGEFSRI